MSVAEMFSSFIANLAIANTETISLRYGELTAALNKKFRDTDSKVANTLQVGSFGRKTGINGISDLDMLYIMPKSQWDDYNKENGQRKLLQDARDAIKDRYPATKVRVDRLVVTVTYTNFHVEVQPVFEQDDKTYKYPDTKNGGSWKITKPREEMDEMAETDSSKKSNLRRLCKMVRAWKNKHGVAMGGLLVDTLAYNYLTSTTEYDTKSYLYYDFLSRDFFKYLSELPEQNEYAAPGSRQRVKVKKKFQKKAKKAHRLCLEAIEAENQANVNDKWKRVYGRPFPSGSIELAESRSERPFRNTEEFIEDKYPVDIRESLAINCDVMQNGFRKFLLRYMFKNRIELRANKKLRFWIEGNSTEQPYSVFWKVLNRGAEAERRDCVRGQIVPDAGHEEKIESTTFVGDHVVECYCVKDGVVVAKSRIHVPINADGRDYD
jgi:hypothetical protein